MIIFYIHFLFLILHYFVDLNVSNDWVLAGKKYQKLMQEENLDLISRLPFEIQQKIILFIPLKEAVRTIALSAHWKSLWSPVEASLNFDANPAKHEEKYQVMRTFIKSFVFPKQWKLYLNVVGSSEEPQIIVAKVTKGVGREHHLEFFESTKKKKKKI